jgi:hypothetical protein
VDDETETETGAGDTGDVGGSLEDSKDDILH